MIESRLIRELRAQQEQDEQLVAFVELLVEALAIPEVRAAVRAALDPPEPTRAAPSGRGTPLGRRGR